MFKKLFLVIILVLFICVISVVVKFMNNTDESLKVVPINQTTMMLKWAGKVIYIDPVGDVSTFLGHGAPDLILLTDHQTRRFDLKTLEALSKNNTDIIAPMPMAYMFPETVAGTLYIMKNGQKTTKQGFKLEATAMYDLPESKDADHKKGDGNGYVVELAGKQIDISIDPNTELVLLD